MRYLVCYDITEERRRSKVAKFLSFYGRRIQKSVFTCDIDVRQRNEMLAGIIALVEEKTDRCHIFPLSNTAFLNGVTIGSDLEPDYGKIIIV